MLCWETMQGRAATASVPVHNRTVSYSLLEHTKKRKCKNNHKLPSQSRLKYLRQRLKLSGKISFVSGKKRMIGRWLSLFWETWVIEWLIRAGFTQVFHTFSGRVLRPVSERGSCCCLQTELLLSRYIQIVGLFHPILHFFYFKNCIYHLIAYSKTIFQPVVHTRRWCDFSISTCLPTNLVSWNVAL